MLVVILAGSVRVCRVCPVGYLDHWSVAWLDAAFPASRFNVCTGNPSGSHDISSFQHGIQSIKLIIKLGLSSYCLELFRVHVQTKF